MRGYRINKEALGGILEELKKRKRSPIGALKQGGIFEIFHTFSPARKGFISSNGICQLLSNTYDNNHHNQYNTQTNKQATGPLENIILLEFERGLITC